MKMLWLTDIHLNFLPNRAINAFCDEILAQYPDLVLIAGDIAEAPTLHGYLSLLEQQLQCPVYFVLGNHDYYHGSVVTTRKDLIVMVQQSTFLHYLPISGVVELTPNCGLIGHDGWSDGRYGSYDQSTVMLNDYRLIAELSGLARDKLLEQLNAFGNEAACYIEQTLTRAVKNYSQIYLLTHVPPFHEACWHEGKLSDDNFAPHFSCKAVGDVLLKVMSSNSRCNLTVLCGHTHSAGVCQKLPNLQVITGGAVYSHPQVQTPIYIV